MSGLVYTTVAWTLGPWELVIIGGVALLIFGGRLPQVGRSLGRGIVEFKKGLKGIEDEIENIGEKQLKEADARVKEEDDEEEEEEKKKKKKKKKKD